MCLFLDIFYTISVILFVTTYRNTLFHILEGCVPWLSIFLAISITFAIDPMNT